MCSLLTSLKLLVQGANASKRCRGALRAFRGLNVTDVAGAAQMPRGPPQ